MDSVARRGAENHLFDSLQAMYQVLQFVISCTLCMDWRNSVV